MNALTGGLLEIVEEVPGAEALASSAASPKPAASRRTRRLGLGEPVPFGGLLGPAILLLFWWAGSTSGLIDSRTLPSPLVTVKTAAALIADGRLGTNMAISAARAAEGLVWGVAAGVILALISGLSRLGGYVFDGVVQMKRAIPILALIPLLILWLGIGEPMKITIIAVSVFIPIYVQTQAALRDIETRHLELAETLRLSRWTYVREVVLPGALPGFLLGLRFAVTGAWLALVVVEQLNATSGIGYMINLARTYAQTEVIVVGLAVYALLGLTADAAVRLLEARLLGWRRTLAR